MSMSAFISSGLRGQTAKSQHRGNHVYGCRTVLAAQALQAVRSYSLEPLADDDAHIAIIATITLRLQSNKHVSNPVDPAEDLSGFSSDGWNVFIENCESLKDISERARDSEDEAAVALVWAEAFTFLMPLPDAGIVEILEKASGSAMMQIPDATIHVYSRRPRQLVATYTNQVPTVMKDCDLEFRISNPSLIPAYATVEWTVRNEGQEAEARTDSCQIPLAPAAVRP
jgi:Adenylyl/Guanylyl and SMODS C-terminal sensor domain